MSGDDLAYWRTLALERGRALDALHARLRAALALVPEERLADFVDALNGRLTGWMREPDRMEPLFEPRPSDVAAVLDDLWTRVESDGGR